MSTRDLVRARQCDRARGRLLGGAIATEIAARLSLTSASAPYQVLLTGVAVMGVLSLATVYLLTNDRPAQQCTHRRHGSFRHRHLRPAPRFQVAAAGFITALGAGQLIPFLNVFVKGKFGLDLADVNAVFAVTSLGTTLAILAQPALARRFGRIGSIVLVQGSSIPFCWCLASHRFCGRSFLAMTVRNSLMNAGSPIFDAFAMDRVSPAERATLSAGMTLLWALGLDDCAGLLRPSSRQRWGSPPATRWTSSRSSCSNTVSTWLLWHWFRGTDIRAGGDNATVPIPLEAPTLLEHA